MLALLVLTPTSAAHGQEAVAVRAGVHPGFGRLVLEWPVPVEVEGWQEGRSYAMRFARPLEPVPAEVLARLRAYLVGAGRSPDGRQLTLDLAPGIAVRQTIEAGRILVLDLAPTLPSEQVEVRSGVHDGFGRIVFAWREPIRFDAITTDRQVSIRFSRGGEIDAVRPAARLGAWLASASASRRDGRSEVRLELQPGVSARPFQVDARRVAVDLSTTPARPGAEGAAGEARPSAPAAARPADVPTLVPMSDAPARPPERVEPAPAAVAPRPSEEDGLLEFAWPDPVAAAVFVRAGHLWVVFAAETSRPEDLIVPPALSDDLGPGEIIEARGGTVIRFPLRRGLPVGARRADRTWRVRVGADAPTAAPLYPLRLAAPARLRLAPGEPVRLVELRDPVTGDRLTVWPLLEANLGQPRQSFVELELLATAQGLAWRLRSDRVRSAIVDDAIEFEAPGGLALSASSVKGRIAAETTIESRVSASSGSDRIGAGNPETEPRDSDRIAAETTIESRVSASSGSDRIAAGNPQTEPRGSDRIGAGNPETEPRGSDRIAAETAPEPPLEDSLPAPAVPSGTPAIDAAAPESAPRERRTDALTAEVPRPLGLAGGGLDPAYTAAQRRSALLQTLARAAPEERATHRLELARFYLSRGLGAEALGVLGSVEPPEDEAGRRARQALTGAAGLLMGRIDVAAAALGPAHFDDDPEVALWRSALAASRQDWPRAARELERSEQILATYPQALRLRLGLAAARTAIATGDTGLAATLLAELEGLGLAASERARLELLSGVASARSGDVEAADQIWRVLEQDAPVEIRIEAAFARTELLLAAGELLPAAAIARLAATRGLWPGHPREEDMLRALAQMHADAGDGAGALRTWRELLDRFPDTANASAIMARMRETLVEILLAEGESELGQVQAYALFREFERLIPNDQSGDGLRRRAAARPAELDLIRPAAALLDSLVHERLAGVDKAAAGADLAELWLREPAPEAALAALERSRIDAGLPAVLDQRRRTLEADALARMGRRAAALALLDGLDTPAADDLRVGILRQEQDWPRLISTIEHALARRQAPSLTDHEQAMALELALAHGRLGHTAALAELRTRFAAALRGSALEPAFLMATNAPAADPDPEAVLAIAERHLRDVRGYLAAARSAD